MKKISNPPNPFESTERELLEPASNAKLEVFEDASRSILTENDSPDLSFRWTVNPYRGCFHSCAYCYARRYHEYIGMGAGTDFESKITIKRDAPELLKKAFHRPSWKGETIVFSGITDCYQPLEAVYKLTQGCLSVCLDFRNPVALITKSALVARDVDLLQELNRVAMAAVTISIPFSSDDMARKIEPQASTIERRFKALRRLSDAGIPVGVSLAPTIPGLNENDMPIVMARAKDCGARWAFHSMVRLSGSVLPVFEEKIRAALPPERVDRILKRIRESRGGEMNNSQFGSRMQGKGTYWDAIEDLFRISQRKHGLTEFPISPDPSPFRVPSPQLELGL